MHQHHHRLFSLLILLLLFVWLSISSLWMMFSVIPYVSLPPCNMVKILQNRAVKQVVEGQVFSTDIDCRRILDGDQEYIEERAAQREQCEQEYQQLYMGEKALRMDCAAIWARRPQFNLAYYHHHRRNENYDKKDKRQFPLAFGRAVYQDYLFLEMELAVHYQPQNWYCYALDAKSSPDFHNKMRSLANCLPNVLLTEREFVMDSGGHHMSNSLVECMHLLTVADKQWEYLILLQVSPPSTCRKLTSIHPLAIHSSRRPLSMSMQNHDIQLKTNQELVQIFKWFGGANDIQFTTVGEEHVDWVQHDWSLAHLRLFKNESKNWISNEENDDGGRRSPQLQRAKGQAEASLSRAFVEWLTSELNVDTLLAQLNSNEYAVDEFFLQILAGNEFLGAPGGYTLKCRNELSPGITRFNIWPHLFADHCHSGMSRHGSCIFGLEDLAPLFNGENNVFLFANKMMPARDAEAIQCWHEEMANRNSSQAAAERRGLHRLRKEHYTELPQVRFHKERTKMKMENTNGTAAVDSNMMEHFECRYKFLNLVAAGQEWTRDTNTIDRIYNFFHYISS